jgi:hypothetical protein
MAYLFEKLKIEFDDNGNASVSKTELLKLIAKVRTEKIFKQSQIYSEECYALIDAIENELYPFPVSELQEWEEDGSFEKGDALYKMQLIKKY